MRVVVACPSLNSQGGAERLCMYLIKALKSRNYDVKLITLDRTNWTLLERIFGESFKPDKETYLFSKLPRIPTVTLRQAFVALTYLFSLSWTVSRRKYDLLINMRGEIVNSIGDLIYINAVPLGLMHRYPQIKPKQGGQWGPYSRIYAFLVRFLRNGDNTIVTNSNFTRGIIEANLQKKALVVHPGIELNNIIASGGNQARENVVITVSRFRFAKGLEIIPKISQSVRSARFTLIGISDDASQECLKQISRLATGAGVQDRIQIFDNMPFGFILGNLLVAKIFLHTQAMEAFGMAIVEAMAAGCVPVVPRDGGPWFDILEGKEGVYGFSYGSISEAAQKIRMLLENDELRTEVSARARRRATDFDSSVFESEILRLVKKVCSRKFE